MQEEYCGYCFRYCPFCQKEVFFFLLKGDGCRAYLCRNYESHRKEAVYATESQKQTVVNTA